MLYVAHVSYTEEKKEDSGLVFIPCIVEADNIDSALEKLHDRLLEIQQVRNMFNDVREVYLESISEFRELPKTATILQKQRITSSGEGICVETTPLPTVDDTETNVQSYSVELDDEEEKTEDIYYEDGVSYANKPAAPDNDIYVHDTVCQRDATDADAQSAHHHADGAVCDCGEEHCQHGENNGASQKPFIVFS